MIKYQVKSRQLIDIMNDLKESRLILSPYFQRKLVWRDLHKVDFIKTILLGFPFPEIFIARGDLDVEKMITTSCIVDGQQRLNSIREFIADELIVDGEKYSELDVAIKEQFLKYEIAIIELDIKHDDEQIREIFQRLNRTFYSLSSIEKTSSEYAASEFVLSAKLICNELNLSLKDDANESDLDYDLKIDPNIPGSFILWAKSINVKNIVNLLVNSTVFSTYEISRQVHLNYALNIFGTIMFGFFNRNLKKDIMDNYSNEFDEKEQIIKKLDEVAKKIIEMKFVKNSMWLQKANMFSLLIIFYTEWEKIKKLDEKVIKNKLKEFESDIPPEYAISAKEGVNNRKERLLRNTYLQTLINSIS